MIKDIKVAIVSIARSTVAIVNIARSTIAIVSIARSIVAIVSTEVHFRVIKDMRATIVRKAVRVSKDMRATVESQQCSFWTSAFEVLTD